MQLDVKVMPSKLAVSYKILDEMYRNIDLAERNLKRIVTSIVTIQRAVRRFLLTIHANASME